MQHPRKVTTMRFRLSLLVLAALALILPGCSYLCHFKARGVIRDAMSGQPIPNVQFQLVNSEGHKVFDPEGGDKGQPLTNQQGEFEVSFRRSPHDRTEFTGWKLILSAKGYETETIEVGPVNEPKRDDETAYLIFSVMMRKAPKGA
jgi:hypothetical protein